MRTILWTLLDHLRNASLSAAIGLLIAIAGAVVKGEAAIPLDIAGAYSLVGALCGTLSRLSIETVFSLFGPRR